MTIAVADFRETHALSTQVEQTKMNPAIAESLRLDLRPVLSADLLERAQELKPFVVLAWPVVLADVSPGFYAERRERVFKALTAQPETDVPATATTTADWEYLPLHTLWHAYLKPYWKQAAWVRYLPTHGVNLEKAGLTVPSDPQGTFQAASSTTRAQLLAAAENTAAALLNRLLRFVQADYSRTASIYPDHSCGTPARPRRRPIRGI